MNSFARFVTEAKSNSEMISFLTWNTAVLLSQSLHLSVSGEHLRSVNWNLWLKLEILENGLLPEDSSVHLAFWEIHNNSYQMVKNFI